MFTAGYSVTTILQLLKEEDVSYEEEPVSSDKQIYEPIGGHLQSITISNLIIIFSLSNCSLKVFF